MKFAAVFQLYAIMMATYSFASNYSLHMEGKIFGGDKFSRYHLNHVVSIRHNNNHFCAGSLISKQHVLTAAKCLNGFLVDFYIPSFEPYTVLIGDINLNRTKSHAIEQVEVHKRYVPNDPTTIYFDIGVITLMQPIEELSFVSIITMSREKLIKFPARVHGWEIKNNEITHEVNFLLKEVKVILKNKTECGIAVIQAPVLCSYNDKPNTNLGPEDVGASLVRCGKAIGVLAIVPQKPGDPSIYIDIFKSHYYINLMLQPRVIRPATSIPRKRARYDQANDMM